MARCSQRSVARPRLAQVAAAVSLLTVCVLTAGPVSSAAARAPHVQITRWEKVDSRFAPAFDRFEGVLQAERATVIFEGRRAVPSATAKMKKAAHALIPAIRLFDARLAKTRFTGALAAEVHSLRSANNALVAILAHLDVSSFESQFLVPYNSVTWPVSLEGRFDRLYVELSRQLGQAHVLAI